jgi:2,4-dienoyl-CoA reductase-like NADH-dependent reductase (Old Yellow Enzyme family)/thioredoxin reductase
MTSHATDSHPFRVLPAFARLFEPVRVGRVELRNRLVMLPMETNYATEDGLVTDRTKAYYGARAAHVGLVLIQITCVESVRGKGYRFQLCIDHDGTIPGLRELADTIHGRGARAFVQLHHAGANARGSDIVAASPLPVIPGRTVPRALTAAEIADIVGCYGAAAVRARTAGFDGVEIVASGGYLVWNFLSRALNARIDDYGGCLENRARLLLDIIREVRGRTGDDFPITCRLACRDYGPDSGFGVAEAQEVAALGVEAGLNGITTTAIGGDSVAPPHPGLLLPLAGAIKQVVNVPVTAAGRMDLETAAQAVAGGLADLAGFGRRLLADADYVAKAASGADDDIRPCIACKGCIERTLMQNLPLQCGVNPVCGRETTPVAREAVPRRIVVVGGGPAGMQTAIVAAARGHDVTLFEERAALGGQLVEAALPPGKGPIAPLTRHLSAQIAKNAVTVRLGTRATRAVIEELHPDAVVLAAGRAEFVPRIPGAEHAQTALAGDVLTGKAAVGLDVVILGGELVGCETAEFLVERGRRVSIVEIRDQLMFRTRPMFRAPMLRRLAEEGVRMFAGVTRERFESNTMIIELNGADTVLLPCDTIVYATGGLPNDALRNELAGRVPAIHAVGDCTEIGDIAAAIGQGFEVACGL